MHNITIIKRCKDKLKSVILHVYIKIKGRKVTLYGKKIKYIVESAKIIRGGGRTLIVIFSGFPVKEPTYNYIKTLWSLKEADKLFILDDFGYRDSIGAKGSYYLCEDGEYSLAKSVKCLIGKIRKKYKDTRLVCVGSSKGGTAALLHGIWNEADAVICGAPQFWIADYLDTEKHREILKGMIGEYSKKNIDKLNNMVKREINQCGKKPQVFVQYSKKEHIAALIKELKKNNFDVVEECVNYKEHAEVAAYFPNYLINCCKAILKK